MKTVKNNRIRRNASRRPNRLHRRRLRLESLEQRQLLAADLLFADSFEVGEWNGQWVEDSQKDWHRSSQRSTDGSYSAEVDGKASDATLSMANPLDLSSYESAELTFSWYIESRWDRGEYMAVDVYNGGWQEVARLRGNADTENVWHHPTINLDSHLSEDFRVRFRATVSSSGEDGNVDNVQLTGIPKVTANQVPLADAGADQTLSDAGGNGDEFVMLTGTGSDNDGTIVSYEWTEGTAVLGTTASISPTLTVGTHTLTLTVTDNDGASASDTVIVTINEVLAKPVKVFLLAGQSNMTGTARVENLEPAWDSRQDDVWMWLDHNMDGGQWTSLEPGHGLSTHAPRPDEPEGLDPRNALGPELSLGKLLADAYPDHRVALIKHGDGGRDLDSHFNPENIGPPESNEHMWSGLLKKTDDAFAVFDTAGYTYEVEGFFLAIGGGDARNRNSNSSDPDEVLAGEEEALERSARYGENLTNFIAAARGRYATDLPFIMTRIGDDLSSELLETYPGAELVRQGQLDVAASDPWTEAFTTEGITLRDAVHFDAMGQIEFGTRLSDSYFDLLSPTADDDTYDVVEDGVLTVAAPGVLDGDTDPEGDPLTVSLVDDAANGDLTFNADGSFIYTPDANFSGSDSFTYVANDGIRDSNLATVIIEVTAVNDAPVADDQSVAVKENTVKVITLSASDVEGDSLTYSIQTSPTSGTLSGIAPDLNYTPNPGFTGTDSFTFVANDGSADSNVATVFITVADNLAHEANPQSVSLDEDSTLAITLSGSDPDGDPITYIVVDLPTHGMLTGTAPDLTYTPDGNFHGSDSFTFKVNDGTDESALAVVSITVDPVNDAPVANTQSLSTDEDTPLAVTLSGSDIDGDALSYVIVSGPSHGSLSGSGANRTYTPNSNFNGSDSFTFKVSDGTTDSEPTIVNITVEPVNDAPVAVADSYSVDQDVELTVAASGVLTNDTDVDGDTLTAVAWSGTSNQGGPVVLNSDGSFTYTPPVGFTGTDTFSYNASDGSLASALATVSIEVQADDEDAMYVYDIRFESRKRGRDQRAVFEIRWDSNGNGQGDSADARLAGVAITVEFDGRTYSGTTDSNGIFRTGWRRKPGSGTYAEVVDLSLADYTWDPLALDLEDDSDGDGLPDAQL